MQTTSNYGTAIELMKAGLKVARASWNDARFVFLVPGSHFKVSRPPLLGHFAEGHPIDYESHIDIHNADGTIATWTPSNADQLAEDWFEVV